MAWPADREPGGGSPRHPPGRKWPSPATAALVAVGAVRGLAAAAADPAAKGKAPENLDREGGVTAERGPAGVMSWARPTRCRCPYSGIGSRSPAVRGHAGEPPGLVQRLGHRRPAGAYGPHAPHLGEYRGPPLPRLVPRSVPGDAPVHIRPGLRSRTPVRLLRTGELLPIMAASVITGRLQQASVTVQPELARLTSCASGPWRSLRRALCGRGSGT